jgi:hypothetical protein
MTLKVIIKVKKDIFASFSAAVAAISEISTVLGRAVARAQSPRRMPLQVRNLDLHS